MAKRKYPSELKSRNIRANVDTWQVVKSLSIQLNITMADALDRLIAGKPKPERKPEPELVAVTTKPAFRVTTPVTKGYRLQPVIATNGSKVPAFRIKQGRVRND